MPFEQLNAYNALRMVDRLTPELLRAYGETIGLPFWDPASYGNAVALLQWGAQPRTFEESLKMIVEALGLKKGTRRFFRGPGSKSES